VVKAVLVNANCVSQGAASVASNALAWARQTQITELEVALAAAIEAKRVADLAAPWQAQLTLTDSALLTANTVVANASQWLKQY
jgi:hypothetical protein